MATRTALYLRISQDQSGQALGVTRQREDCQAVADAAGWRVAEVYVDNDISAYKDRPAYNKLLDDIQAGQIDAVIAWAPDRMYRRLKDLETLIEIIETHQIEIRTVKAGDLDLSGAYGRMLARILGSVAAGEGEIKSERWRRSWRQGREAGDYPRNGERTYGYTAEGEVIPEEREVARWMANQVLDGTPIQTICGEMESRGIHTSRGGVWTRQGLKRYLMSPRIAAWSSLTRFEQTGLKNAKGKPQRRLVYDIIGEGHWEPLIDRETWEGVRAILGSRSRPHIPRKALINGLIFCGACGHRLITSAAKGARTYRCPNRPGLRGCGKVSGNALPIEEVIESYARTRLADPRTRRHIGALRAEGDGGPMAELVSLELRLTELEKQLDDPAISLQAITRAIERATARQVELQSEIAARSLVHIPASDAEWPDDLISRRRLVDLVVKRVELNPATRASRLGFDPERVVVVGR